MEEKQSHNSNTVSKLNKELDFDIVKTVLKRNWYIIPIVVFLGLSAGFIFLRYNKPLYESSAIIQRTSKDEGKRILEINNFEQESKLSEDVEFLGSTYLLEKALKKLNLEISYYSEGKIKSEEKYLQSSYYVTDLELKDSSLIGKPFYIRIKNKQFELVVNKSKNEIVYPISDDGTVRNDQFVLTFKIKSKERFWQAIDENELYFVFNDYKTLTNTLHKDLSVFVVNGEAKTIQINFKSNNSLLSTNIVGALVETFFEYDLDKKIKSSENILVFIEDQLDTVHNQLKEAEDNIQYFTDPEVFKRSVLEQIHFLQTQFLQAELENEIISELSFGINSKNRVDVYNLSPSIAGTRFEYLFGNQITNLYDLLIELEDESFGMTVENNVVKNLNIDIDIQVETLSRTLNSIKRQVKLKKENIEAKIIELSASLHAVPAQEMELSRLRREFNLSEKYYSLLIEKRTQYEISKAGYTSDNIILQEPSKPKLISPQKELIYTGVIIMSVLISFLLLIVKFITFNVIHNESELKKLVPHDVGFLGNISRANTVEPNSKLMVHLKPKSMLAETFRNIRSNLNFVIDSDKSNVIAISSSVSGEGKTFLALNLGGILNMSGKKVLILDLDLRKPKVHLGFDAPNLEGMSSVLADKRNWHNCVQSTELDSLDFISAGITPPNPSELILNGILDTVISEMKEQYDYVIIDNPPVGIISDGIKVLNSADCSIYVFRANYSRRIFANKIRELLGNDKVEKLFMVLNDVDMNLNSFGYGYGYGGYYEEDPVRRKWFNFKK